MIGSSGALAGAAVSDNCWPVRGRGGSFPLRRRRAWGYHRSLSEGVGFATEAQGAHERRVTEQVERDRVPGVLSGGCLGP
jgi:hypothetical protein